MFSKSCRCLDLIPVPLFSEETTLSTVTQQLPYQAMFTSQELFSVNEL